jgi:hypothetical protein
MLAITAEQLFDALFKRPHGADAPQPHKHLLTVSQNHYTDATDATPPAHYRRYIIEELDGQQQQQQDQGEQAYDGEDDLAESQDRDDAIHRMTDSEYLG